MAESKTNSRYGMDELSRRADRGVHSKLLKPNTHTSLAVTVLKLEPTDDSYGTSRREITIRDGETVIVGRASKSQAKSLVAKPDNAYFDCPVVSREHARIKAVVGDLLIEDSGSMHGTFVNDDEVAKKGRVVLKSGAVLRLGTEVVRGSDIFPPLQLRVHTKTTLNLTDSDEAIAYGAPIDLSLPAKPLALDMLNPSAQDGAFIVPDSPEGSDAESLRYMYEEEETPSDEERDAHSEFEEVDPNTFLSVKVTETISEAEATEAASIDEETKEEHSTTIPSMKETKLLSLASQPCSSGKAGDKASTSSAPLADHEDEEDEDYDGPLSPYSSMDSHSEVSEGDNGPFTGCGFDVFPPSNSGFIEPARVMMPPQPEMHYVPPPNVNLPMGYPLVPTWDTNINVPLPPSQPTIRDFHFVRPRLTWAEMFAPRPPAPQHDMLPESAVVPGPFSNPAIVPPPVTEPVPVAMRSTLLRVDEETQEEPLPAPKPRPRMSIDDILDSTDPIKVPNVKPTASVQTSVTSGTKRKADDISQDTVDVQTTTIVASSNNGMGAAETVKGNEKPTPVTLPLKSAVPSDTQRPLKRLRSFVNGIAVGLAIGSLGTVATLASLPEHYFQA